MPARGKADSSRKAEAEAASPFSIPAKSAAGDDAGVVRVAAIGAASAGNNERTFETAVPAPVAAAVAGSGDVSSDARAGVAETLRACEPSSPAPVEQANTQVQDITVRITAPDAAPVDLRVSGRGADVQVSVHTQDAALQTSLREDLGTLTSSLERAGYHADTFVPEGGPRAAAGSMETNSGGSRQQQEPGSSGGSFDRHSGSLDRHSDERRDQRQRGQQSERWLEEMEKKQL
jgi:hypothetical protein